MSFEEGTSEPKIEHRREILYGTPGLVIYRDGKPVLWVPDDFGSQTRDLSYKDLEALQKELRRYFEPESRDDSGH
ncbi:MAG TPA: hypothetical protein G4O10_09900 [Dehalococcoidia bacterium]|nr:hypothetical protein [Dehalococcoidia bacterium]